MKKILRLPIRFGITMAVGLLALSSCEARLETEDHSFTLQALTKSQGAIYVNADIPIEIQMAASVTKTIDVDVECVSADVDGTFYDEAGKEINLQVPFKHKFEKPLYLTFRATAPKENATLTFNVNGKAVTLNVTVSDPAYNLYFAAATDTVIMGVASPMQFKVVENPTAMVGSKTKAGGATYTLTADILTGKGVLVVKERTLFNTGTKAIEAGVELTKEELTNASFMALATGINTIQLCLICQRYNFESKLQLFIPRCPMILNCV